MRNPPRLIYFSLILLVLAACSGSIGSTPAPGPSAPPPVPPDKIKHIVVLVQENRSFNNLFAGFPGATTSMAGLCKPGHVGSVFTQWCKKAHEVHLKAVPGGLASTHTPNEGTDIGHEQSDFQLECDAYKNNVCRMDGFDLIRFGTAGNAGIAKLYPYAYVARSETKPYWDFARQYALADEMFFTETAASFISHQMLISGTVRLSDREVVTDEPPADPWGCDSPAGDNAPILHSNGIVTRYGNGPSIYPCFKWATIADLLDANRVSWLDYVDVCCNARHPFDFSGGSWNGFRAIHRIYHGPDWKTNISSPNTNIFSDVTAGTLPAVSWVIPTLYDSDHPQAGCDGGPWWVTKVVDAIGTSRYWKNTAIVVVWDDWGGWYDPVPPKYVDYHQLDSAYR